eukprot:3219416-Pleurochrysis_carterae.AAC.2
MFWRVGLAVESASLRKKIVYAAIIRTNGHVVTGCTPKAEHAKSKQAHMLPNVSLLEALPDAISANDLSMSQCEVILHA